MRGADQQFVPSFVINHKKKRYTKKHKNDSNAHTHNQK